MVFIRLTLNYNLFAIRVFNNISNTLKVKNILKYLIFHLDFSVPIKPF